MKSFNLILKLSLFIILITAHALADIEPNDTCSEEENLTIQNGTNIFDGIMENGPHDIGIDYYKITVPADGDISIYWESGQLTGGKTASLIIGTACDDNSIYDGDDAAYTHGPISLDVNGSQEIYIKIYNGSGTDYTLTIDYEVDLDLDTISKPVFCYGYYFDQGDTNLSSDTAGYIDSDVDPAEPLHINLSLYLIDLNNTSPLTDIVVDIIDLNLSQAPYNHNDSVWVKRPGTFFEINIDDTRLTLDDPTAINDIPVGSMTLGEYFSIDYTLDPALPSVNFPLNALLTYDTIVPTENGTLVTVELNTTLQDEIEMCEDVGGGYLPAYSIFNIEHNDLNEDEDSTHYNLPTQTASRVDDLEITAYDVNSPHDRNPVSTFIGLELIDLDDTAGFPNACSNPNSAISPRIWIPFLDSTATGEDDNSSIEQYPFNRTTIEAAISNQSTSDRLVPSIEGTDIATAEEFYSIANKNTAFRVVYNSLGDDGGLINVIPTAQGLRIDNFTELVQDITFCRQPVTNPQNDNIVDRVSIACSNDGNNLTYREVAICMECLYGYDTHFLCSRDNFAIRPESFRVSLSDQDQTIPATKSHIKFNTNSDLTKIVAGYNYAIEVNATNYLNDNATPGYNVQFSEDNATDTKHFGFVWDDSNATKNSACNDINDHNKLMTFTNGNIEGNISNAQIGHYYLEIIDNNWTEHDYDPALLTHHAADMGHYYQGQDCILNSSIVPAEGNAVSNSGINLTGVSGCDINSTHTSLGIARSYTDINTEIYPYKLNVVGLSPYSGPNAARDQSFVYINTPDINDSNMSYNINGTFYAAGYDDGTLSNFVHNCYADNLDTTLYLQYQPNTLPTDSEPYLSYDLVDTNSTGVIINPRPSVPLGDPTYRFIPPSTGPLMIEQNSTNFVKDMNGSITMDLGYNFKRNNNEVMNPRMIEMNDFNITYRNNPTDIRADLKSDFEIYGNKDLNDSNVSFYYGRTKASKFFYEDITDDSVSTPITIVVYCNPATVANTCSFYGINTSGLDEIDEPNWYLSTKHQASSEDGNVTLKVGTLIQGTGSPSINPTNITIESNGIDKNVTVASGADTLPLTVPIELVVDGDPSTPTPPYTNEWLIYNEADEILMPSPFYKVRFIGDTNWTGEGQTGHVMEIEARYKKSQRSDW